MDNINYKRLVWMAHAKSTDMPPEDLFGQSWGIPACIAARAALTDIDRLKDELDYVKHKLAETRDARKVSQDAGQVQEKWDVHVGGKDKSGKDL